MVTATRRAKQAADLKHVVENVLDIDHLDSYLTSISFTLIGQLIEALPAKLEKATRPSSTAGETDIAISSEEVTCIIAFQHYVRYMKHQPELSLRIQDYATINGDSFDDFKSNGVFDFATRSFSDFGNDAMKTFLQINTSGITNAAPPASTPTSNTPKNKLVDDFRRGRREPSSFLKLNNIEDFTEWDVDTKIQAKAQEVQNVLDPTYIPTTPDEIALFDVQKAYMSAVLNKCLVLAEGRSILRDMGSDPDPQIAYAKLARKATNSSGARYKATRIIAEFNQIQYDDGSVQPGAKTFIEHVQNLFQKHDFLTANPEEYLRDIDKKQAMRNAVHPNPDLRAVGIYEDNLVEDDPTIRYTYVKYLERLRNAAEHYDSSLQRST